MFPSSPQRSLIKGEHSKGGIKQNGVQLVPRVPFRPHLPKEMRSNVVSPGAVVLLLALGSHPVSGNYTILASDYKSNNATGPNIAAIVAPTVTLVVLAIAAVVAWLLCVVKKKRQTEGAYRPSAEEQSGTHSVAALDAMKLPKEERLI